VRALTVFLLATVLPALADPVHGPAHPAARSLGKFGEWQVAIHKSADGNPASSTCFTFTRSEAFPHAVAGHSEAVLSVTRRPGRHDVAALSAGFTLAGREDAPLQAGATRMLFYVAGRSAFAHDNAAAIAVFGHEQSVTARLTGPRGGASTDRFSLKGFASAYAAMGQACPVR